MLTEDEEALARQEAAPGAMPRLFPEMSGSLYVIEEPSGNAISRAEWGTMPHKERTFAPDECWGLRRGRSHRVVAPGSGLRCRHVHAVPEWGYLCIPMMAHGESIAVFHLRARSEGAPDSTDQLATTVSEHIGLALANLSLRQTLREQAIRDPLTGLFNRRHMEEMLEREISRAQR